jgi:hypothetical protein
LQAGELGTAYSAAFSVLACNSCTLQVHEYPAVLCYKQAKLVEEFRKQSKRMKSLEYANKAALADKKSLEGQVKGLQATLEVRRGSSRQVAAAGA